MANVRKFRILAPALVEFWDGFDWYLERNQSVADDFKNAFSNGQDQVRNYPTRWAQHLAGTRSFRLIGFPYHIVYTVTEDEILIVAVAHTSRRPAYWKDRISE